MVWDISYMSAMNGIKGDNCLIMTNKTKTPELHKNELDFIKGITGHEDKDMLILGFGKSDILEENLIELRNKMRALE